MPIYFTADADMYCEACCRARYGTTEGADREGNPIGAVFSWDERPDYCPHCGDCGGALDTCTCDDDRDDAPIGGSEDFREALLQLGL